MPKLPASPNEMPSPGIGRADVLLKRAKHASLSGHRREAIQLFQRAVAIDPTNPEVRNLLGIAYGEDGDLANAIEQFDNSLRIDPDQAATWQNRGIALSRVGHMTEAIACFDRMITLRPDQEAGYVLRADTLFFMGRFQDAVAAYDQVVPFLPGDAPIATNRGAALQWSGRFEEALAEYDRATALDPNYALAWGNKGILMMTLGDLPNGLPLYEWRWRIFPPGHKREMGRPPWLGDTEIAGKTLFVYWEQGLGDTLHACRYASLAAKAGARVILEVQKPLFDVMRTLDGVSELLSEGDKTPEHDLHCPVMSLPLAFGTTIESIPAEVPYLRADPEAAAQWSRRLAGLHGRRIGLVWAGGARIGAAEVLTADQRRSVPLTALAPLAAIPGCTFISLQVGPPSEQAARPPAGMPLHDHTDALRNFADTAALIANLDLVISVDTATAHLAGAMGTPVWLLNRFDTDWRWLLDRTDSPWYPTMRIFRQPRPGDWASVVQSLAEALREFVAT
jgi:tetratricopeptide (TPR) repeat protein